MGLINLMGPSVQADMGMPTDLYPRQKAPIVTGKPVYQAPEKKGFFEKLGSGAMEYLGDPTNRARLAAAFNTMRLNPDPNIARMAQSQIENQQALDLLAKQGNKTAEWLKSVGREDLAKLVAEQPQMAKSAVAEALKAPKETFQAVSGQQLLNAGYTGVDANKMYNVSSTGKISQVGGAGINISTGQDAFTTAQAKVIPEQISAYTKAGGLARSQNTQLMQMASMFEKGVPTGRFEDTKNRVRSFAQSLGLPVDEDAISDAQTLQAFTSTLVAEELRQNKGPQTDFDARYAQSYMPSLDKDPAANMAILNYMMSRNSLTSALGQLAAGSRSTDFDKMNQLRNALDLAANTLGAVVYVDGTPILFNEFLNAGKSQRKSIGEILREWEQLH